MKRICSIAAGLLTAALLTCPASALSFPDVAGSAVYADAVENVNAMGLMVGDTKGNFNPEKTVSRGEMAAIVCRMLGTAENLPKTNVFTDVPTGQWANAYIGKASQLGIVQGYGDGRFGPADPVTYEQAVTMVVRAIGAGNAAVSYGGYPNGYLQAAKERYLLEDLPAAQGQGMTRGAVAMLLDNRYMWCFARPGDGHTHRFVEETIPGSGTGGHYEQVQVGTKQVLVRTEKRQYSKCLKCGAIAYEIEEIFGHYDPESPYFSPDCWNSHNMIYDEYVPIYEDQPVYENRWVEDSATTIRICELCGQLAP